MRLASMWIKQKKNMLFFQPNFHFFFGKKCGLVHRKISDEKMRKNEVQKKCIFCARKFGGSPTFNIIVRCSFDINIDAPRVWGMSGHYTPATAGHFFKKCQKMPKNRSWGILPKAKCCSVWIQQNFFYRK